MPRSRKILHYLLLLFAIFLIISCASKYSSRFRGVATAHISSTVTAYAIPPQVTDNSIDDWLEPHYVAIDPSVESKQKLFLFLSGAYGHPTRQSLITQHSASLGYHAINLRYPNSATVGRICRGSLNRDCHEQVRLEIIDGVNRSSDVTITRANSIENRLVKLLLHLHKTQPDAGWLDYLEGDLPKWESIVVAGHSQGAGHAAMIAHQHLVARVIMFGGPSDTNSLRQTAAPWLAKLHATPSERYYGLVHLRDRALRKILRAWKLLGMDAYGPVINIDETAFPYSGSHTLVTNIRPTLRGKYHGSVITDHSTPLARDGKPLLNDVWKYLCD